MRVEGAVLPTRASHDLVGSAARMNERLAESSNDAALALDSVTHLLRIELAQHRRDRQQHLSKRRPWE